MVSYQGTTGSLRSGLGRSTGAGLVPKFEDDSRQKIPNSAIYPLLCSGATGGPLPDLTDQIDLSELWLQIAVTCVLAA